MSTEVSPSTVPSWKNDFDQRVSGFAAKTGIPEEKVREAFSKLGATGLDEDSLSIIESEDNLPMSDLFKAFVDTGLTQVGRVRLAHPILRGTKSTKIDQVVSTDSGILNAINKMIDNGRPKSDWSNEELLARYNEDSVDIINVLKQKSAGRFCIVFNSDGTVNQKISLEILKIAKRQVTSEEFVWEGKAYRVYRAGVFPANPLDESPLAPGVALIAGVCPKTHTNWAEIPLDCRQLVRIYATQIETKQLSLMEYSNLCSLAKLGAAAFRSTFAIAALKFDELQAVNKLPTLKFIPSQSTKIDNAF